MRAALVWTCLAFAACGVEQSTSGAEVGSQRAELRLPPPPTTSIYCPEWARTVDRSVGDGTSFEGVGCVFQRLSGATSGTVTDLTVQFPVFVEDQCSSSVVTAAFGGEGFPTPALTAVSAFNNGVCEVRVCGHVSPSTYSPAVLVTASDALARVTVTQWSLSSDFATRLLQFNYHQQRCILGGGIR